MALGTDSLVLDVKFGSGAFNQEVDEAIALAQSMLAAGERAGKQTTAFVTSMDEPIGRAVGNWLEVAECIDTLQGEGPADLEELVVVQSGQMLLQAGVVGSRAEGVERCRAALRDGSALAKFRQMVEGQGGDLRMVSVHVARPLANGLSRWAAFSHRRRCVPGGYPHRPLLAPGGALHPGRRADRRNRAGD